MPIVSNPQTIRVKVAVGEAQVVLVLRSPTTAELSKFLNERYGFKGRKMKDASNEARLRFVDKLLVGIEGYGETGEEEAIVYHDPADGSEKPLNRDVPNWTAYVNPSWKIAAALELEVQEAEIEGDTVKN